MDPCSVQHLALQIWVNWSEEARVGEICFYEKFFEQDIYSPMWQIIDVNLSAWNVTPAISQHFDKSFC